MVDFFFSDGNIDIQLLGDGFIFVSEKAHQHCANDYADQGD
jgi:hypothetical protein